MARATGGVEGVVVVDWGFGEGKCFVLGDGESNFGYCGVLPDD